MAKRILKIIAVLFITFLIKEKLTGQNSGPEKPFYKFHRLNEVNGLSNNYVNDILQDNLGFIWVATNDGLFRYDGAEFKVFRHRPDDSTTIPHNAVQSLHQGNNNTIWAMTDFGIGIYNQKTQKISQILPDDNEKGLLHKSTTSVCDLGMGKKFIGTFGGGVLYYEKGKFNRLKIKHNPDSLNFLELEVMQVFLDNDSVLWVGTWNEGLIQVDLNFGDAKQVLQSNGRSFKVYTIHKMNDNSIWVGTNHGLFVLDNTKENAVNYTVENTDWLPDNEILTILQDSKNRIWIGTRNKGLLSVDSKLLTGNNSLKVTRFQPSSYATSISHRTISKVIEDSFGNLWLGTHNSGINVFNPSGEAVKYFTHLPDGSSLSYQSVWGICEAGNNSIFVGTDGNGVDELNPYSQEVKRIPSGNFSDKAILCALKTSTGKVWFGTYSGGINIYDSKTGKVEIIDKSRGLKTNDIRDLFEDTNNNIWIATNSAGLYLFNSERKELKHIESTDLLDIRAIDQDNKGNIWLATFGDGLAKYNPLNDTLTFYNWHQKLNYTPVAFSLVVDGASIWIGTRLKGLVRFDITTNSFTSFSDRHGLPNNTVRALVFDKLGQLWISTNVGISFFDREKEAFRNFDSSDGLQIGKFNDGSALLLSNGDLAFGGIHGINIFSPKELLSSQATPGIVFTDFIVGTINNEEISDEHLLTSNELIELNYTQNTFTIKYNALIFPDSESWKYDYFLEGHESDWNKCQNLRMVTYRNLPPGNYIFKVRVCDKSGLIKGEAKQLKVIIFPPWWRTWPAYIFYSLLFMFIIYTIIRYNNKQIKLKQGLIFEKKLREQEHEALEQQARFFTNFSHELRSPLTLIQGPVNDLLNQECLDEQKPLLKLIKRNSAVLLKLVKRLLEFRKIETEKTVLNIDKYDLSVLVKEEADSFGYQASQTGSKLIIEAVSPVYAFVDIEKVQIILNNLLSNAIKYTGPGGIITISLIEKNEGVYLLVTDTGTGIPKDELEAIFSPFYQAKNSAGKGGTGIGLALTKSLVELHEGVISVESSKSGSSFKIYFPNNKDQLLSKEYVKAIIKDNEDDFDYREEQGTVVPYNAESKKSILVVDDNIDILTYVQTQLKEKYYVVTAENGEEAYKTAEKIIPDLVISDIMMPKVDGIELCKKLKESKNTNHIPILFLTAKAADTSKVEAYKTGADGYITKPFTSELLLARVENLLLQRDKLKELLAAGDWEKEIDIENTPDLKFIKNAESTILSMIDEAEISVPKLAQELGFSRTSLYRKIKAITSLSINQFIRIVKLKKAAQLLEFEDVTVSETAFQLGFTDLKYFRSCFKDKFGLLPSEYQKQKQKGTIFHSDINHDPQY